MSSDTTWTHGCDACGAPDPVEYVQPVGYLCAKCREPEAFKKVLVELYGEAES